MMTPLATIEGERGVVLQRRPDLRSRVQDVLEPGGHDADDGDGNVIEQDLPPDKCWIGAETPSPQRVADDGYERTIWLVRLVVRRLEIASQCRPHTQHTEEVRADELTVEPLWFRDAS